jgi:hypothetical protein
MLFMKKSLILLLLVIFSLSLKAQKDTLALSGSLPSSDYRRDLPARINIYPVPVRDNSFTIKSDKDILIIRVTNIIGQDVFRIQYNSPQQLIKIFLENPKRGMYLVTIIFSDGTKTVKKIMVEETE